MDLTEDLVNIQGIFLALDKNSGALKKIRHRGGNEIIILNVITELHKFLSSKNYIKDKLINAAFDQEIKNITLFLVLNTDLKKPLDEPEYQHLINIMPQLSTCLLANTIIGLDLTEHFCKAMDSFSFDVIIEIVEELVPCMKKCKPKIHITNAHIFLRFIITKLSALTKFKNSDEIIENLMDHVSQILLNLTGWHGDHTKNVKIDLVYECMGLTLLNLLDLLLIADEKHCMVTTIIEIMLKTCCSIMDAVTVDVFCSWAEFEKDEENLQNRIAHKSYTLIEKYQKYPPAKELITKLGTVAQKPKTVHELIHQANTETMITMINKADISQKLWMRALINSQVLKCEESIKCISRWAHLCTGEDISRLLDMSVHTKSPEAKKLVIKCASTLDLEELVVISTRYFYKNGIGNNLNEDVQQQMILLFNKMKDKNNIEEFSKELHLLLLQNPQFTLKYIFDECLKNSFYLYNLKTVLPSFKEVANINNTGINILNQEIASNPPNENNCKNYTELFNTLVEINFFTKEKIVALLLPILQKSLNEKNFEVLRYSFSILNNFHTNIPLKEDTQALFDFIFDVIHSCRCKLFEFDVSKQETVKSAVEFIEKYLDMNITSSPEVELMKLEDDIFVSYYRTKIVGPTLECPMIGHLFHINFENDAETVTHLIRILPLCVTQEWLRITSELIDKCGVTRTIELLCDVLILLCQLVNSQETKTEEVNSMFKGLKYCLQNFGIVIKESIQVKIGSLEEDVAVTKNVCRVLKDVPNGNLKNEEGLSLANLLSEMSLRSLKSNKQFACLVAAIQEPHICQMLAEKILSS